MDAPADASGEAGGDGARLKRVRRPVERIDAQYQAPERTPLAIPQGRGTPLGDIPNVAFKLTKVSRNDDLAKSVHRLLFRKPAKAMEIKKNVAAFRGYSYEGASDEQAEKAKDRERLDRYTVAGLHELMDLFDISRASGDGKEAKADRIFQFLCKPEAREGAKDLQAAEEAAKAKVARKRERNAKKKGKAKGAAAAPPPPPPSKRAKTASGAVKKKAPADDEDDEEEEEEEEEEEVSAGQEEEDDDDDDDDDVPLGAMNIKSKLTSSITAILKKSDLDTITMKTVRKELATEFGEDVVADNKAFIKETVTAKLAE
ncbi:DEK domain-containing chromatin-associated protein 4 [Pycnococcus provasolii]